MAKILQIQQIKSGIGYKSKAKATLAALGLKRLNQIVQHKDCREIQGMIKSISYLLKVKEL